MLCFNFAEKKKQLHLLIFVSHSPKTQADKINREKRKAAPRVSHIPSHGALPSPRKPQTQQKSYSIPY